MSANLSEAQKNIENEAIGKHNEKVTYLFLIIYDGKYVLYFNNTRGVCQIIWRKLLEELLGSFSADTFFSVKNNISSVAKYCLEVKVQINVVHFSDQAFAFDMHQEYYMTYICHLNWSN